MAVHRTALGVLMIACSIVGAVYWIRRQVQSDYYARHASWRDAPREFAATCVDGAMLGVGTGLSVAALTLSVAVLLVRFSDGALP